MVKPARGTTTLAFVFKHGVIVAADSCASMGNYICTLSCWTLLPIVFFLLSIRSIGAFSCGYYNWYRRSIILPVLLWLYDYECNFMVSYDDQESRPECVLSSCWNCDMQVLYILMTTFRVFHDSLTIGEENIGNQPLLAGHHGWGCRWLPVLATKPRHPGIWTCSACCQLSFWTM